MDTATNDQELESASVTLVDGLHFAGDIGGIRIDLDAEESVGGVGAGPQPHRLLLLRADQHPRVYTRFEVLYRVRGANIDPQAVARAIELSTTRYCPVIGLLGKVAEVATRYEIE